MKEFKISFCGVKFQFKPNNANIAGLALVIAKKIAKINEDNISAFVRLVSEKGCTFCPATFKNGNKTKEDFDQQQLFTLDFDGGISFDRVKERAERYDLPMLFAYDTYTSTNHNKFRVSFLNDVPITNIKVAEAMLRALTTIFPEADPQSKSPVQMYFGSNKGLLYFDKSLPEINIESLIRNTTHYLEDQNGTNHYKRHVEKFSKDTGIALNKKKVLDVTITNDFAEITGANDNGKNLPKSTIITIPLGRNFPNSYYRINFGESCTNDLCKNKKSNFHRPYRSSDLTNIKSSCRLFQEFESGSRVLHHNELFGIATNLLQVETGCNLFRDILKKHSYYDDQPEKYQKWDQDLRYIREYQPFSCNGFCSYSDTCSHGTNIISTSKPKHHQMERLANYEEQYVSTEEAEEDFKRKFNEALNADTKKWYIIQAQTSLGKTKTYLEAVRDTSQRVLIAVPTNKLKREVRERAKKLGIEIVESPSLHEIKDDLPNGVWDDLQTLYNSGRSVVPYLKRKIKEDDPECAKLFKCYLRELEGFNQCDGHAITTHKRLLTMDVSKFDLVIVDEDIIFSTIIPNKTDVTIKDLKRLKKKIAPASAILKKVNVIIKQSKEKEFFTLPAIDYDKADDGKPIGVDVPSLCAATHFCYRKASGEEEKATKDTISFLNHVEFPENTKYVMVSATVDKTICEYYFGKDNIEFHECSRAAYRGTLNQYYDKTMSRGCIAKDKTILDRIKKMSGFKNTITFMRYDIGDLHFGNTAGCDFMKDEDIDVIGTPHQPEWIYKLFAFSIGCDCDLGAKINRSAVVEHNGYRSRFATYDDKVLRAIQFYMLESELEQAVGRARLLRCGCTVNLFSNFPLRQAMMKRFEDEETQNIELLDDADAA